MSAGGWPWLSRQKGRPQQREGQNVLGPGLWVEISLRRECWIWDFGLKVQVQVNFNPLVALHKMSVRNAPKNSPIRAVTHAPSVGQSKGRVQFLFARSALWIAAGAFVQKYLASFIVQSF